jgi:hypothetical protein
MHVKYFNVITLISDVTLFYTDYDTKMDLQWRHPLVKVTWVPKFKEIFDKDYVTHVHTFQNTGLAFL